jgi:hypothetical protein
MIQIRESDLLVEVSPQADSGVQISRIDHEDLRP